MLVTVNGIACDLPESITVADLLEREGEPAGHVVVEIDGVFLAPRDYASRRLAATERVEIILPAFGG